MSKFSQKHISCGGFSFSFDFTKFATKSCSELDPMNTAYLKFRVAITNGSITILNATQNVCHMY